MTNTLKTARIIITNDNTAAAAHSHRQRAAQVIWYMIPFTI